MGGIPRQDTSGWAEEGWQESAEMLSSAGAGFVVVGLHPPTFSLAISHAACSAKQGLSCVCSVVVGS